MITHVVCNVWRQWSVHVLAGRKLCESTLVNYLSTDKIGRGKHETTQTPGYPDLFFFSYLSSDKTWLEIVTATSAEETRIEP